MRRNRNKSMDHSKSFHEKLEKRQRSLKLAGPRANDKKNGRITSINPNTFVKGSVIDLEYDFEAQERKQKLLLLARKRAQKVTAADNLMSAA